MNQSIAEKATIFIGSSSEAIENGIAHELQQQLQDDFDVRLWAESAVVGSYTLDSILLQAKAADAAIFMFCKDDTREHRGSVGHVTRDNVVFEYGLFTALLGRDRVAVIEQRGVQLPSDILGVLNHVIDLDPPADRRVSLRKAVIDVRNRWRDLTRHSDNRAARLKLERTLIGERERVAALSQQLSMFDDHLDSRIKPVEIDSTSGCVDAYAEALSHVHNRFWTTTFLSSGFWTRSEDDIVGANRAMMGRLRQNQGEARRLFLLNHEPAEEIRSARDKRRRLRQFGEESRMQALDREFKMLCDRMATLQADGCEVRIAFDDGATFDKLPRALRWSPTDSEMAIYDDFRVDVFDGGSVGRILGVRSYDSTPGSHVVDSVRWYFEQLWNNGKPVDDFLARMRAAVESVGQHIDYEPNWLAAYEFNLNSQDETLKESELEFVKRALRQRDHWGRIQRCLDIGTCTGRYPLALRDALADDGLIFGIDADPDCVRFASNKVARELATRIEIRHRDFLASDLGIQGTFDLVTCMLGTVSHFGYDRTDENPGEMLPQALRRMRSLLTADGLLIVGTWSDDAIYNRRLLSIYSDDDRNRLAAWSPRTSDLRAEFRNARLAVVDHHPVDPRLNVWVLQPQPQAV